MQGVELWLWVVDRSAHELALFAAVGILIGGLDDILIDLLWIGRTVWRRLRIYSRHPRADAGSLLARRPGPIAIFIPTWDEAGVIGAMLETAVGRFGDQDYRLYVACYRNDPATIASVELAASRSPRIRLVINDRQGPTTKADNLNILWEALLTDEAAGFHAKAIALHDAEDVVHAAEIAIFDALCERFDLVQLPVLPLIERGRGWWSRAISSTYADEFAEQHAKQLVVREATGAAVPAAGVGCAFSRAALGRIAAAGRPFDGSSATEDYELGLRIAEIGGRGIFVRVPTRPGGPAVAVRAHFPDSFEAAIRQKSRWLSGIALDGWNRLGWRGGLAERWMRLRDRRSILAALILCAAYLGAIGWMIAWLADLLDLYRPLSNTPMEMLLFAACGVILVWRLAVRAAFVTHLYGLGEGLRSIPRAFLANIIAMAAARRALHRYLHGARGGQMVWDKTKHSFPRVVPAE